MGYTSDGSVNTPLNGLITDGYIKEDSSKGPTAYPLTGKGTNAIFFLRLPDRLLLVIEVIGVLDVYVAFENLVVGIALSPYTGLISGAALLGIFGLIISQRRRIANEFLDIREPLEESESTPQDVRDDVSVS
jgi:hypothetical protein